MAEREIVVGIDLGTTYSALAYVDEAGVPKIVPNSDNERTTPSVVYLDGRTAVVGRIAKEMAVASHQRTAQFVKSYIGRRRKRFRLGDEEWAPEEISAVILRKLVNDAEAQISPDRPLRHAVITVPAFFNEQQRKSTADAGRIAGLNVLSIINEPTAAALAYGLAHLGSDKKILVYDLGGGTFDVTIMAIEGNVIKMLATDGDVQLGGKDWDQRLIEFIAEEFQKKHGIDPRDFPDAHQELITHAEQAKLRLSKLPETRVSVTCEGVREIVSVTRAQFEELTSDLLAQTETTLCLTVEESGLDFKDIDVSLLVGGSTRMKAVIGMFERLMGKTPKHILNPDECVAQGAAIHAVMNQLEAVRNGGSSIGMPAVTEATLSQFELLQERLINAHTLGIKALDPSGKAVVAPLIPRGSHVPCRVNRTFQTQRQGQEVVRIAIMEGESQVPEACTEIGKCMIRNLPQNLAQGTPIEVVFEYTQDSRLNVGAALPTIGEAVNTDVERTAGMTPEEIEQSRQRIATLAIE